MARNIELKARAVDFVEQSQRAEALSGRQAEILYQEDTFFRVPKGRLKLRVFSEERGELIAYERPNQEGPKVSHYEIAPTNEPQVLHQVLAASLGVLGKVIKTRHLYKSGRTRIHFDVVEGLGEFIELEVVLDKSECLEDGEQEARGLMECLGIAPADLLDVAYVDLLERKARANQS